MSALAAANIPVITIAIAAQAAKILTEGNIFCVFLIFEAERSASPIALKSSSFFICFFIYLEDFAKFILLNRLRPNDKIHDFDLVYGVMSDSNPNILVPKVKRGNLTEAEFIKKIMEKTISTRQLSVHNQSICDNLVMKAIHYVKEGVVKHVENIGHGQQ